MARQKLRNRLRRANGQLAAVERALQDPAWDEHDDCVALMTQMAAVEGALAKARGLLLTHHVETCVADALSAGSNAERDELVGDLMDLISRQLGR